jgi:3-deoxy-7-phosphoheptulonate synthase
VPALAKAAVAVGADGLIIEVHYKPEEAICDGYQSLSIDEFALLMSDLNKIALAVGREILLTKPSHV